MRGTSRKYVIADSALKRIQVDAWAFWLDADEHHPGFAPRTGGALKRNRWNGGRQARRLGHGCFPTNRRETPQIRAFNPAGLSFGFDRRGKRFRLVFGAMPFRRRWQNWPRQSGGPPLFELSFKLQRDGAHDPDSGFAVLPWWAYQRSTGPKGPKQRRRESASGVHAMALIGRTSEPTAGTLTSGLPRVAESHLC
jgi:hypothetical protein